MQAALDPSLDHTSALATAFRDASPFPYLVIESFFGAELATKLVEEFPAFERGNNLDENRRRGRKAVFERLGELGGAFRAVDELVRSEAFLAWLGEVTGIHGLLFDPDYLGGGTHENLSGQSLDFHIDFSRHPRGWQRRLNLLVYLNPEWSESWGGCLELRQDPRQAGTRITPLFNRAVLFETSERSWHGFDEIRAPKGSRRSLAFYFYTDGDAVAIRRVHSTVYIDAPLPAGTAALGELRFALQRRTMHLERLVAEEKRLLGILDQCLGQTLELGLRSLDEPQLAVLRQPVDFLERRLAGLYSVEPELNAMIDALTVLPRVEVTAPLICLGQDGLFVDSWVGKRLQIRLASTAPTGIALCGWCPPDIHGQVLRVGDQSLALVPDENFRWSLPFSEQVIVHADLGWVPSRTSDNPDTRELAFVLHRVEAET